MQLPENKTLVKVTYAYEDGSEYFLDVENTEKFERNIENASISYVMHSGTFRKLEWTEKV